MTSPTIIAAGQVFVMEARFADADTGALTNPSTVTFSVTYTDWAGRYATDVYVWAGANTPNITNPSTGVFKGTYTPVEDIEVFSAKMSGAGAVVGASDTVYVLIVP